MTPEECLWLIEIQERISAVAAAATGGHTMTEGMSKQLVDMRRRLDQLSAVVTQVGLQAGVAPEYLVAGGSELVQRSIISPILITIQFWNLLPPGTPAGETGRIRSLRHVVS
jgi:hypothetical protein